MSRVANQVTQQIQQQGADTQKYIKAYYAYNIIVPTLATATNTTGTSQIQADADFLLQALSFYCLDLTTNGQIVAPNSTIQVTDTSNGTTLFDQAIPIVNAFGTAQLPFLMPVPRLFTANSLISIALNNVVSTNAQYYAFTFHGRKIFALG